ncbi:sigma-B regulation protein RsbU (phosphoserine phosphatase) [Granulicella rosea]|uniref:Sigma-B regulation protein RsbU (Phosphoserine phosphatase) n=1 Tax=Granulicella rosea TaxID=474952 RepID=A0A239KAU9_9BACT|nr:fused response regulator/phosphatase [Granulicella rosea]SNT14749.1 sigma-B regulation protein RsbU (phosphoserine phosphatase) [Granulicella rosea]
MTTPAITLTEHHIKVLLVDDQRIVGETIRRMLLDIPGLEYRFCIDPTLALAEAESFGPTVILQDLIMPGVDGIDMVRAFRAQASTASTPLIVLSSKEEATTKADAFNAGANDYLVKLPDKLEVVARIRYHSAAYILRLQRDEAFKALEAQQRVIAQELADAAAYVRSLLPAPMAGGSPVPSDWRFITSTALGGDSFGYHWLNPDQLAMYLLDVCGHGVGSALLSVSAINTIRNFTLPDTDFAVPSQVLSALNKAFPMGEQDGKYFTMWYGVFTPSTRELRWASGGHPPAIAIAPDGSSTLMSSTGMMIGAFPFAVFGDLSATIAAGTKLYVYSDGCYEVSNADDVMMNVGDFTKVLAGAAPHADALDKVVDAARAWQGKAEFEDDFSLVEFKL